MADLTLSIPDDLDGEMKQHREIRWSEVARQAVARKLEDLCRLDELLARSRLTGHDVAGLGRQVKEAVRKRHWKKAGRRRSGGFLRLVVDADASSRRSSAIPPAEINRAWRLAPGAAATGSARGP